MKRLFIFLTLLIAVFSCKKEEPAKTSVAPTSTEVRLYINADAGISDIAFRINSGALLFKYNNGTCDLKMFDTTFSMNYGDTLKWGAGACCTSCTPGKVMWDGKETQAREVVIN